MDLLVLDYVEHSINLSDTLGESIECGRKRFYDFGLPLSPLPLWLGAVPCLLFSRAPRESSRGLAVIGVASHIRVRYTIVFSDLFITLGVPGRSANASLTSSSANHTGSGMELLRNVCLVPTNLTSVMVTTSGLGWRLPCSGSSHT